MTLTPEEENEFELSRTTQEDFNYLLMKCILHLKNNCKYKYQAGLALDTEAMLDFNKLEKIDKLFDKYMKNKEKSDD